MIPHQNVAHPRRPIRAPTTSERAGVVRDRRQGAAIFLGGRGDIGSTANVLQLGLGGAPMLLGRVAQVDRIEHGGHDGEPAGDDEGAAPVAGHADQRGHDDAADGGRNGPAASMNVAPRARSRVGSQAALSLAPAGETGASVAPRPSRVAVRRTPLVTRPPSIWNPPHSAPAHPTITRGPKRSRSQPPGNWKSRYVQKNEPSQPTLQLGGELELLAMYGIPIDRVARSMKLRSTRIQRIPKIRSRILVRRS